MTRLKSRIQTLNEPDIKTMNNSGEALDKSYHYNAKQTR
jgi:hypothetical protein